MLNRRSFGGASLAALFGFRSVGGTVVPVVPDPVFTVPAADYAAVFGGFKEVAVKLFGSKSVVCTQENIQAIFDEYFKEGNKCFSTDCGTNFCLPFPFSGKLIHDYYDDESGEVTTFCNYFKNGHLHRDDGPAQISNVSLGFYRYGSCARIGDYPSVIRIMDGIHKDNIQGVHVTYFTDRVTDRVVDRIFALGEENGFEYRNYFFDKIQRIKNIGKNYKGYYIHYKSLDAKNIFKEITDSIGPGWAFCKQNDNVIYVEHNSSIKLNITGDDRVFPDGPGDDRYSYNELIEKYRALCVDEGTKALALHARYLHELDRNS